MNVALWGTRGSLPSAGADTIRYGGNTSCVEVRGGAGTLLVLDAGTGIRRLGSAIGREVRRVDILLTHLHMDHLQGLGFFQPLYQSEIDVHIWGPPSTTLDLRGRLAQYMSPPLFPVRLRDLPSQPALHDVPVGRFAIGEFDIQADLVCHPGPTVGYRISDGRVAVAYLPDHEPALGVWTTPLDPEWTSGFALAAGADLLIHDAQYTDAEYETHVGWGHSSLGQAIAFAAAARVKVLIPFHHDPAHGDEVLDHVLADAEAAAALPFRLVPGTEGATLRL